jgi:hypothetical protein
MARGKRYPLVKALEDEYNIVLSNSEFDQIASLHIRKEYNTKQLFRLINLYGRFRVRPEIMTLKPLKPKIKWKKEKPKK